MLSAVGLYLGWMVQVCGVDCVIASQPPCSSVIKFTDVGAEDFARAYKTNTTLKSLNFYRESCWVMLCCVVLHFIVVELVFVDVGRCWVVFDVDVACAWRCLFDLHSTVVFIRSQHHGHCPCVNH